MKKFDTNHHLQIIKYQPNLWQWKPFFIPTRNQLINDKILNIDIKIYTQFLMHSYDKTIFHGLRCPQCLKKMNFTQIIKHWTVQCKDKKIRTLMENFWRKKYINITKENSLKTTTHDIYFYTKIMDAIQNPEKKRK